MSTQFPSTTPSTSVSSAMPLSSVETRAIGRSSGETRHTVTHTSAVMAELAVRGAMEDHPRIAGIDVAPDEHAHSYKIGDEHFADRTGAIAAAQRRVSESAEQSPVIQHPDQLS